MNGSEYESVLQLEPALLGGIISTLTTALAPVRLSSLRLNYMS